MMPPVAVAIPMFFIYKDIGLMDSYTGIILIHALMNLPLAVLLLKSFFDDIPREIDESAIVDGASRWKIFRRIILPMAKGRHRGDRGSLFHLFLDGVHLVLTLTQTGLKTRAGRVVELRHINRHRMGNMAALGVAAMASRRSSSSCWSRSNWSAG